MPTPTITFRSPLRDKAMQKSKKMGIPLSLVLNNAIKNFLGRDNTVLLGLTKNGFTPEQEAEILRREREDDLIGPFSSRKDFIKSLNKKTK